MVASVVGLNGLPAQTHVIVDFNPEVVSVIHLSQRTVGETVMARYIKFNHVKTEIAQVCLYIVTM